MRVFIVNSAGRVELPVESGKHNLPSYNNTLLLEVSEKTAIKVETPYEDYAVEETGTHQFPIQWDRKENCKVVIRWGTSILKYQFQLEGVIAPPKEEIENLLKFAAQIEENFNFGKEYAVEELFEAIRADRVSLIIEKTPYSGYDNQSLLKNIAETVPMIMDICSHPKQSLRTEEAVLDVNLVKRINSRTMDHLSSHSEHWKARTLNGLIPNRLRTDIFEDEINIYENLFFRMAVDDILKYVHRQALSIEKTIEQNDNAIDWNAYGQKLSDYKRIQIFKQLLPDYNLQERESENSNLKALLEKWSKLEKNFSTVEASQFFRRIDKKKFVSRNIRPTNILKKDSRYNALYRLWCLIQRQVVEEQKKSKGISLDEGKSLNNCYSMYAAALLLYVFKLLECKIMPESKFIITNNGEMQIHAELENENMQYIVKSENNKYGTLDIIITFMEKIRFEYPLPAEVWEFINDISKKLPDKAKLDGKNKKIIFYAKPTDTEQRELKNLFHLSNTAKKGLSNFEKNAKDAVDKVWRQNMEEFFASDKLRDAQYESLRINPQYVRLDSSEANIEKYTQVLLDGTKDTGVYLFPIELGEYKKNIKSDKLLYRLLNYGERYHEDDAKSWGNYRTGIVPVAQSEINSAQRLMKLISLHSSRLQIKWGGERIICPVCGSKNCNQESDNNWICMNSECGVIFGRTKHAEGCGESYEWTRPHVNIKAKDIVFGDTMNLMLRKEIIFDRLTITDFEFEKQTDGKIKYIPVCPKCGKRTNEQTI